METKQNNSESEAMERFQEQLYPVQGGKWLGVIARVTDDGEVEVVVHRTSWEFPRDKFLHVVGLLSKQLMDDTPVQGAKGFSMEDFTALQAKIREKNLGVTAAKEEDKQPMSVSLEDKVNNSLSEAYLQATEREAFEPFPLRVAEREEEAFEEMDATNGEELT